MGAGRAACVTPAAPTPPQPQPQPQPPSTPPQPQPQPQPQPHAPPPQVRPGRGVCGAPPQRQLCRRAGGVCAQSARLWRLLPGRDGADGAAGAAAGQVGCAAHWGQRPPALAPRGARGLCHEQQRPAWLLRPHACLLNRRIAGCAWRRRTCTPLSPLLPTPRMQWWPRRWWLLPRSTRRWGGWARRPSPARRPCTCRAQRPS
jgi:hypothetical protein